MPEKKQTKPTGAYLNGILNSPEQKKVVYNILSFKNVLRHSNFTMHDINIVLAFFRHPVYH